MTCSDLSVPVGPSRVPIVGIGVSAGGIRALQELFGALPAQPGAAFVVILHLDPTHQSELASIIQHLAKIEHMKSVSWRSGYCRYGKFREFKHAYAKNGDLFRSRRCSPIRGNGRQVRLNAIIRCRATAEL